MKLPRAGDLDLLLVYELGGDGCTGGVSSLGACDVSGPRLDVASSNETRGSSRSSSTKATGPGKGKNLFDGLVVGTVR